MINYNISINKELADVVDREIKVGKYANRSEFFRDMIRDMFVREDVDVEVISPRTQTYKKLKKEVKLAKNNGEVVSWREVKKQCGLK